MKLNDAVLAPPPPPSNNAIERAKRFLNIGQKETKTTETKTRSITISDTSMEDFHPNDVALICSELTNIALAPEREQASKKAAAQKKVVIEEERKRDSALKRMEKVLSRKFETPEEVQARREVNALEGQEKREAAAQKLEIRRENATQRKEERESIRKLNVEAADLVREAAQRATAETRRRREEQAGSIVKERQEARIAAAEAHNKVIDEKRAARKESQTQQAETERVPEPPKKPLPPAEERATKAKERRESAAARASPNREKIAAARQKQQKTEPEPHGAGLIEAAETGSTPTHQRTARIELAEKREDERKELAAILEKTLKEEITAKKYWGGLGEYHKERDALVEVIAQKAAYSAVSDPDYKKTTPEEVAKAAKKALQQEYEKDLPFKQKATDFAGEERFQSRPEDIREVLVKAPAKASREDTHKHTATDVAAAVENERERKSGPIAWDYTLATKISTEIKETTQQKAKAAQHTKSSRGRD